MNSLGASSICRGRESTTLAWAAYQQPHPPQGKNKTSHPIPSHHWLPLFPPLGAEPHEPLTHPCRMLTGWIVYGCCAGSHSHYEFMSTAAQRQNFMSSFFYTFLLNFSLNFLSLKMLNLSISGYDLPPYPLHLCFICEGVAQSLVLLTGLENANCRPEFSAGHSGMRGPWEKFPWRPT